MHLMAHMTRKSQEQDTMQHLVYDSETVTLTTQHAASSYGQPVVIRQDGSLVDYAAIEAVHLLGSEAEAQMVAQALEPFGIRVTHQPLPPESGQRFPTIAAALVWLQQAGIPAREGWEDVDEEHLATWLWQEAQDAEHPEDLLPRYFREYME
jgi:hypothetical protein